jgi:hypothetical protein
VLYLTPLLRLAGQLDRGHEQRVIDVNTVVRDGGVNVFVQSREGPDLEIWAATQVADNFREIYGVPLVLERAEPWRCSSHLSRRVARPSLLNVPGNVLIGT